MTRSILALNADTGRFLWEYAHRDVHYMQTSSYGDGRLYVWQRHYGRSSLVALDADTGKALWSRKFKESRRVIAGRRGPAFHEGKVLLVDVDDEPVVLGLDARTGKKLWRFRTEAGIVQAPPVVHDNQVFAAQWTDWVYALDAATGLPRPSEPAPAATMAGRPQLHFTSLLAASLL